VLCKRTWVFVNGLVGCFVNGLVGCLITDLGAL